MSCAVVDPCQGNPCQHGGSCQRDGSGFICKCATGFIGTHCEKDINECVPVNPCNNGAHCVNKHGGFQCLCPAGLTGTLCDSDVNECQQLVCLNGATCDNTFGSFHCRCKSGYDGKYCEKKDIVYTIPTWYLCFVHQSVPSQPSLADMTWVLSLTAVEAWGNDGFADTKRFLLHMISQLPVSAEGTHYGIIVYSNDAKIIVRFSERWYHALLPLKLRVLGMEFPDGDTRTDKALKMAGTELYKAGEDRDQVPNVLVVITDGKTAQGSEPYKRVLKPLKDHDVDVIAVGIGDQISKAELTEIAMGKQDRVIQVDKVEDLNINKLSEMIHSIC
ncbi:hypothetical protein OS493_028601 [Desmophyllum pertusum]|uniref:Uncharacterized protein n=1 Tax=Desmophyllum pertusum TaxID=174260 RepID=A0A9W9YX10_9CNID|nr:hypothetical protein OS493_028601 [Desmophyllum pertusum]